MRNAKYIISAALAAALSLANSSSADELNKQITLDKDVATAQRDVNRQSLSPVVALPEITPKNLAFSDRSLMAKFSSSIARLDAATYANRLLDGHARGYVTAGYFPLFNVNLAAGYQFIDNSRTKFNAYFNYDGTDYDRDNLNVKRHHASVFAQASHRINPRLELFGNANAIFDTFNYPSVANVDDQNARQYVANVGVRSLENDLRPFAYNVRFKYNGVNFTKPIPWPGNDAKPIAENKFSLIGGVSARVDEHAMVGIDAKAVFTRYTGDEYSDDVIGHFAEITDKNRFKVLINPYVNYSKGNVSAHVGFEFKAALKPSAKIYFAPDVDLQYRVTDGFGVSARIGGGEIVNALDRVLPIDIYASPNNVYANGHSPLDALLSVNIGPFCGASLSLFGGYTIANDILTTSSDAFVIEAAGEAPEAFPIGVSRLRTIDMKGYRVGVSAAYRYGDLVEASASFQMAPQRVNRGYYPWLDHARRVVEASVNVNPIEKLSVGAKYTLRTGRASYMTALGNEYKVGLGNVNSLDLGATYRLNDRLRFHATVENITNRHWDILLGVPAPGITGLVGATYIFR